MNKFKVILAGAVFSIASIITIVAPVSAAANKCTVSDFGMAMGKSGNITVSDNTATVKFRVNGKKCTAPVSVASWVRVTAGGINDQKLYAHSTDYFTPGLNTMTVKVPDCMYQVDLIEGLNYTAADGTANYQFQNGKFVDGGLRDFVKGGQGVCSEKPPIVVPPVKPPVVVVPPVKVVSKTVVKEVPVTTAAPVSTVPSTGADAGSMAAGTVGLSTSAGLAYDLIRKRRLLK